MCINFKLGCFAKEVDEKKAFADAFMDGMDGITRGFKAFTNIVKTEVNKGKKKNARIFQSTAPPPEELDLEVIKDQIFKKPESLKRVLNKYSTKTYTLKEEDDQSNEVGIKIGICEVFEYIFDMREDFVIDNIVHFFRDSFLEKTYLTTGEELDRVNFSQELLTLLPDPYLKAGSPYVRNAKRLKNYTQYEEIKSFDEILSRSFMESLLLSFFFTNSSPLQNALLHLIQRCCTQKTTLNDSIDKVELLFSDGHKKLYDKIRSKIIKLKNFTSNAQVKNLLIF